MSDVGAAGGGATPAPDYGSQGMQNAENIKQQGEQAEEAIGGGEGTTKGQALKKKKAADQAAMAEKTEQTETKEAQQKGFQSNDVLVQQKPDDAQVARDANWATLSVTRLDSVMKGDPVILGTNETAFLAPAPTGTGNPFFAPNPMTTFVKLFSLIMELQKELAKVGAKLAVISMQSTKELGWLQKEMTLSAGRAEAKGHWIAAATAIGSAGVSAAMLGATAKSTFTLGKQRNLELQGQKQATRDAEKELNVPTKNAEGELKTLTGPEARKYLQNQEQKFQKAEKNIQKAESDFKDNQTKLEQDLQGNQAELETAKAKNQKEFNQKIEENKKDLVDAQAAIYEDKKGPYKVKDNGELEDPVNGRIQRNNEEPVLFGQRQRVDNTNKPITENGKPVYEDGAWQKFKAEDRKYKEMKFTTGQAIAQRRNEQLMLLNLTQQSMTHSLDATRGVGQGIFTVEKTEFEGQSQMYAAYVQMIQRGMEVGIQTKQEADQFFFSIVDFLMKLADQNMQSFSWRG